MVNYMPGSRLPEWNDTVLTSSWPRGLDRNVEFFRISHTEAEKKAVISVAVVESAGLATKTATLRDSWSEITPQGPLFTKVSKHSS